MSRFPNPAKLIRPSIRKLHGYVPGEQPRIAGLIKLNTNENPYPPSEKVLDAVKRSVDARLRLYPDPTAQALREALAKLHGCRPENVIIGNGSDDLLALATRAFVEPKQAQSASGNGLNGSRSRVQFFEPSYSLYPVLAQIQGAEARAVALAPDFDLPTPGNLKSKGKWDFHAALTFVTTPNAPTGRAFTTPQLEDLCAAQRGVTILDEAYVNFAKENSLSLALKYPHVLAARTFSKAYSLCFQRVGYFVGHPELIAALDKVRDSYNVNGLGQIAALETLRDLPYYERQFQKIIDTRERVASALQETGFEVSPSQTNFLFVKPPRPGAKVWLERLRERKIIVRWFDRPGIREFLRVTIGTDVEMDTFLGAVKRVSRIRAN